ncbi:MAG: PorV/PorQ family protein [Flavobacteriaceae bacterium]|nr:PorV/PorQ family protein [Flavobacteriaceae bacterium]
MRKIILLLILTIQFANSQIIRNYSNEFLNIGVDAAAFGMGKAVTATTNDVNAIYWNPAGLVNIEDQQGAIMHAEYFQGIANYDYLAYAKPINNTSVIAISFTRFSVDDILNTTQLIDSQGGIDFDRVSLFNASDMALHIGYAKKMLLKNFDLGVNAKIIHRRIGDFANSWGFGLDVGFQYQTDHYKFGLMLRDITTTFNAWSIDSDAFDSIANTIPGQNQEEPETLELTKPKLQFGVSRVFEFGHDYKLTTAIDLNMRFLETNDLIATSFVSISPATGFQLAYDNMIYLRGGVSNFQQYTNFDESTSLSVEPNFGVGFKYSGIQIDYALANIGGASGTLFSNVFSVKVDFSFFRN